MTTFALGELEDYAGDTDAARRAWSEAVALSAELGNADDVPQFHLQLARLAARRGDEIVAREHLRLAFAQDIPDDIRASFGLRWGRAEVELRLGNPDEALELLRECDVPVLPGPGRFQRRPRPTRSSRRH